MSDRSEFEALWRQRWHQAKLNLEIARIHYREIDKAPANKISSEDHQRAAEAVRAAIAEYSRVLKIYTDLKVHGKLPQQGV